MKRILAVLLCLSLLLGSMAALAEGGAVTAPRTNVTDTDPPEIISHIRNIRLDTMGQKEKGGEQA